MTDNDIIKALECCIKAEIWGDCEEMGCPAHTKQGCHFYLRTDDDYENTIYIEILKDALDLINRQKAEIESLRNLLQERAKVDFDKVVAVVDRAMADIRAKAIKEFAERLKDESRYTANKIGELHKVFYIDDLNELVKEMTEDQK